MTRLVRLVRLVPLLLMYWLAATAAVHVFMQKQAFFEDWHHQAYAFERMLDGSAHRPFAYRVLTPWLVNRIDEAMPPVTRMRYQPAARVVVDTYGHTQDATYWTPELERKFAITFVLMCVTAFGAICALRSLTALAFPGEPALRDAAPLFFGTLLPLSLMNGGFMYDFPELLLMFAAFAAAWAGRHLVLLVLLALAALNKETALLLVPMLSAVLFFRMPRVSWIALSAAMAAVAGGIVLAIRASTADLPGLTVYDHVAENFAFWLTPSSWFATMQVYLPLMPMPRGMHLLLVVPLLVLLLEGWRRRAPDLKLLLGISAGINLPLFFLFAWRDETRNLSVMYPALYLNVCAALLTLYRARERAAPGARPLDAASFETSHPIEAKRP
jgi:hypothetical protein